MPIKSVDEILREVATTCDFYDVEVDSVFTQNAFGDTPLHVVCIWGEVESAATLINAGADVNAIGECGVTPLMAAAYRGHVEIVKLLLAAKANTKIVSDFGSNALESLYDGSKMDADKYAEICRLLREADS